MATSIIVPRLKHINNVPLNNKKPFTPTHTTSDRLGTYKRPTAGKTWSQLNVTGKNISLYPDLEPPGVNPPT